MLKRIRDVHSVFNSSRWEEERKEMEKRIKEMSEFDATGNPKGFSAGVSNNNKVRTAVWCSAWPVHVHCADCQTQEPGCPPPPPSHWRVLHLLCFCFVPS